MLGTAGQKAAIGVTQARAWEVREAYPLELLVSAQPGEVTIAATAAIPPWAFFAALAGVLILLLLVVLGRSSRRGSKTG